MSDPCVMLNFFVGTSQFANIKQQLSDFIPHIQFHYTLQNSLRGVVSRSLAVDPICIAIFTNISCLCYFIKILTNCEKITHSQACKND